MPISPKEIKAATAARIKRTEAYAEKVRMMFASTVRDIASLNKKLPDTGAGEMYSFDGDTAKTRGEVERLLRRLHSAATLAVKRGIELEWDKANEECDKLVAGVFGKGVLDGKGKWAAYTQRNKASMEAFMKRGDGGLGLSERVWKSVSQLREEMEVAITVAVGEGEGARSLAKSVGKYLNNPDLMFKRFRYKAGERVVKDPETGEVVGKETVWGKKWKKRVKDPGTGKLKWVDYDKDSYKFGAGVYKSSAKNAMRVARTETNMAYRRADHERWKGMDFVLGQRIQLSGNHPCEDICDDLAGDYPKDFVFDGWHPQCFCYVTPIMPSVEELEAKADAELRGEKYVFKQKPVKDYPDGFKRWVAENSDRIAAARASGKEPYFIKNNFGVVDRLLNPQKSLTTLEKAALRHSERTEAETASIKARWAERKAERAAAERSAKVAENVLAAARKGGYKALGVSAKGLEAAVKAGEVMEVKSQTKALAKAMAAKRRQVLKVVGNVRKVAADYGEIDFAAFEAAAGKGRLDLLRKAAADLASQVKAQRKAETALGDVIPNVHEWHKKFAIEDLKKVHFAVGSNINGYSKLPLEEQLKKLKFEAEYVEHPEKWVKGKKPYSTWEVAKAAYMKRIAEVEYALSVETAVAALNTAALWSEANPKKKKLAGLVAVAKAAVAAKESVELVTAKVAAVNAEYQKALAEQARRNAKKWKKGFGEVVYEPINKGLKEQLLNNYENNFFHEQDDLLRPQTEKEWQLLTTAERRVVTKYTETYSYLNEPLRNLTYYGETKGYEQDLPLITGALAKCRTKQDMVVRRGTNDYYIPEIGKNLSETKVGDIFIDGGFLSTSAHRVTGFFKEFDLVIYVPKGAMGVFAEPFSHYTDNCKFSYKGSLWDGVSKEVVNTEFEWIGQRGSRFRVVKKAGNTIYLEMIGQLYTQPKSKV